MSAEEQPATAERQARGRFWPALIVALLAAQVLLMLVLLSVATRDPTFSVEPGWYQKSLEWDENQARRRASQELGWTLAIDIGGVAGPLGERVLELRLEDREGAPVQGAEVEVIAFPHHRASRRAHLLLSAAGEPGLYSARMRFRRTGLWEFRVQARRGEESFMQVLERDVLPLGQSRP